MKFIDTHSHQYVKQFKHDRDQATLRARAVLSHCFLPNIDLESVDDMLSLTASAPDFYFPMMGLHPCSVRADYVTVLQRIENHLQERKYYGIGETGLDYYWDKTFIPEQKAALRTQVAWARDLGLPLIIHCRESLDDTIALIAEEQDGRLKGIFHCFGGSPEQAKKILGMNFLLGIGGVVTYKNTDLPQTLALLGATGLVLETDSPYLTPVPHRGKRNESSYIPLIAERVAEATGIRPAALAEITSANALRLFGLS